MAVKVFKSNKNGKLSSIILKSFDQFSYDEIKTILRKKDIKVNGKRVGEDVSVLIGDEIQVFYKNRDKEIDIIYEDDNIIVVFKPRKLEVVTEDQSLNLKEMVSKQINKEVFAVHRIDRNTTGFVVFAKTIDAKLELDKSFKDRTIEKYYLALVCGNVNCEQKKLVSYLVKDKKSSFVKIYNNKVNGSDKIITKFKRLWTNGELSLLEVELVTGKTHQIRAHLAYIGHPILGDEKYGNVKINKEKKLKFQCLCAYKIIFHFQKNCKLSYLNLKDIQLSDEKVDFLKFCK